MSLSFDAMLGLQLVLRNASDRSRTYPFNYPTVSRQPFNDELLEGNEVKGDDLLMLMTGRRHDLGKWIADHLNNREGARLMVLCVGGVQTDYPPYFYQISRRYSAVLVRPRSEAVMRDINSIFAFVSEIYNLKVEYVGITKEQYEAGMSLIDTAYASRGTMQFSGGDTCY